MKALKRSVIALICILAIFASSVPASAMYILSYPTLEDVTVNFVYNGQQCSATVRRKHAKLDTPLIQNSVEADYTYETVGDYDKYVLFLNSKVSPTVYPNATRLQNASVYYNCHSYAWYSKNTSSNKFWIPYPTRYYFDGGYMEVTNPKVGDIICYFDSDGVNQHSGIIVASSTASNSISKSSEYIVESKWGKYGLYRHNGYECPYTSYRGGDCDNVKFYRCSEHKIVYKDLTDDENDGFYHQASCSFCGYREKLPHRWRQERSGSILSGDSVNYVPYSRCMDCDRRQLSSMT